MSKSRNHEIKTGHGRRQVEEFQAFAVEKMFYQALLRNSDDTATSKDSNAAIIAALRKAYFADVDELEASGQVVLPEYRPPPAPAQSNPIRPNPGKSDL